MEARKRVRSENEREGGNEKIAEMRQNVLDLSKALTSKLFLSCQFFPDTCKRKTEEKLTIKRIGVFFVLENKCNVSDKGRKMFSLP